MLRPSVSRIFNDVLLQSSSSFTKLVQSKLILKFKVDHNTFPPTLGLIHESAKNIQTISILYNVTA